MQHSFDVSFNFDDESNRVPLIKISIDGETVGLIQEILIQAKSDSLPLVQMKLVDVSEKTDVVIDPSLKANIEKYKALANLLAKMPGAYITYNII